MIYNTIKHDIRNKANLSLLDYCLLESIYLLSTGDKCKYKTWCNAAKSSFEYLASSRTIVTRFNELEALGWMEFKDETRFLKRTTKKYYEEVYAYIIGVKKLHGEETAPMKELHDPREETAPNNNIDNYTNRERGDLPKHKLDEQQKKDNCTEIKQFEMDIQNYHFNSWSESLKEAFYNYCHDKYDKSNKKFSGTQAKEIIRQIEKDFSVHGVQKVEDCVRFCLSSGWNYKFSYNDDIPKTSQKAENKAQDLESYLTANFPEKDVRYFKAEGKLETWNKLLEENQFKCTNISKGFKNENISPLFIFEILFMPLGGMLNGNSQDRKMESFNKIFAAQSDYNKEKGDFRKIIKAAYEKQKA